MLRDALIVALVAVVTVQAMRRWIGDRYLVPTDSMQPLLYGDPEDGDIVFVDKLASANARRRGDLVVVADEANPGHQLVKRIAARGDDPAESFLDIRNGDVYLGPNRQQVQRVEKDPADPATPRVAWGSLPGTEDAREVLDVRALTGDGPWQLPPLAAMLADARPAFRPRARRVRHRDPLDGVLPQGAVGTNRPMDCSFLDVAGRRSMNGDDVAATDCGMTVDFAEVRGVVLCTIDAADVGVTFLLDCEERRVTIWNDAQVGRQQDLQAHDWRGRLTFGRLDGRYFLLLDDVVAMLEPVGAASALPRPRTYLHVAVVGEAPASIRSIDVFRDVYSYRPPEQSVPGGESKWPVYIGKGEWFLLGDNAFDSRDSRQFGAVKASSFLGVPRFVLGPWSRRRWITP